MSEENLADFEDFQGDGEEEPIVFHVPGEQTSPLWCPGCAEDVNREIEPMYEDDLENFVSVSCIGCGQTVWTNPHPEDLDDELVEAHRKNRADAVEEAAEKGVEQFDLTLGMEFDVPPEQIQAFARSLERAEAFDVESADSETLADYVAALKALKDAAEAARKDIFEEELNERAEVNDEIGPLVKTRGSSRFVYDDEALIEAIEEAGGDPTQAMSVKATDAADVLEVLGLDPEEYIGTSEYSYFRRQS